MIPVYMINGFLESGKTEFISYTLAQPYFQSPGRTLLILCEEGENEYDEKLLKKTRTFVELIEDDRVEARRAMLEAYPSLQGMYKEDDGNTEVLYFKDATATFYSFTSAPRTVKF